MFEEKTVSPYRRTFHVDFYPNGAPERDSKRASKAEPKRIRSRRLELDRRRYTAYDAHSLLELDSESAPARPGHPLG